MNGESLLFDAFFHLQGNTGICNDLIYVFKSVVRYKGITAELAGIHQDKRPVGMFGCNAAQMGELYGRGRKSVFKRKAVCPEKSHLEVELIQK